MEKTGGQDPINRHLVYEKLIGEKGIWMAEADGSQPRLLVRNGQLPVISPDGKWVAYFSDCSAAELGCTYLVSTSGGKPRLLSTRRLEEITWSPTSERIGSIFVWGGHKEQQPGDEDELVSIDVASGKQVTLARAPQFFGWSFSPDGKNVAFAPASRTEEGYYSEDIDLFVTAADGGEIQRITNTGDASDPVWGPKSIAFARYPLLKDDKRDPSEIWQIQPDGTDLTSITKPLPKRFVEDGYGGLVPIDWSEDGGTLLAGLAGNWGHEPIAVDPENGAARELGRFGRPWGANTVAGSRDGRWVLVHEGSFAEVQAENRTVLIVPYEGGKPVVVARGAWAASWNR
jgi:Tol biopolymer transport system component